MKVSRRKKTINDAWERKKIVQFKEIVGNSGEVIVGNMCAHCEFLFPLFSRASAEGHWRDPLRKSLFRAFDTKFIFFHLAGARAGAICIKKWSSVVPRDGF